MDHKNPFEIRTRMLELANEYVQAQFAAAERLAKNSFTEMLAAGTAVQSDWLKYAPKMYDIKDVVAKAQELYSFVSKKD
jgi:hypothetical protein